MSLDFISIWHEKARQFPTPEDLNVQIGCHAEEFVEMLDALRGGDELAEVFVARARAAVEALAIHLKSGGSVHIQNRVEMLDALCDQIVTAVGVGHCAGMNVVEGCRRVNASNWTKFDNGEPRFDKHGKVIKSDNYIKASLEDLV